MCIRLYVLMYGTDITTNALKLVNFGSKLCLFIHLRLTTEHLRVGNQDPLKAVVEV